tara:strand:+ start:7074 stop:7304 length:231 start_codon:yes stop_codon:yes gene_type:complete
MKTVLQLNESDFRIAGKHTDKALAYIKECEELINKNVMFIRTNLSFDLNTPEIQSLNHYLRVMQSQNIIAVQILLD